MKSESQQQLAEHSSEQHASFNFPGYLKRAQRRYDQVINQNNIAANACGMLNQAKRTRQGLELISIGGQRICDAALKVKIAW